MLHVGMNIEDKRKLSSEARRVLKLGGIFGIYDVMRESSEGDLRFPVPWAASAETSFVESAATYRQLLEGADFQVQSECNRREFAIEFFNQMRARAAQSGGPPALGPAYPDGGGRTAEGWKYDRQPGTRSDRAHGNHLPGDIGSPSTVSPRRDRHREDQGLAQKCRRWALDNLTRLRRADPPVPEALHDRAADNWRTLLVIADCRRWRVTQARSRCGLEVRVFSLAPAVRATRNPWVALRWRWREIARRWRAL
jgi:hypothetical protein